MTITVILIILFLVLEKHKWSKRFLRKLDYLIHPTFQMIEHNFNNAPLQIKLNYNALYIVKILKIKSIQLCFAQLYLTLLVNSTKFLNKVIRHT